MENYFVPEDFNSEKLIIYNLQKIIINELSITSKSGNQKIPKLDVLKVINLGDHEMPSEKIAEIKITVDRDNEIIISLTTKKNEKIIEYHSHLNHRNPGGEKIDGQHKHYPKGQNKDSRFAFSVEHIDRKDYYDRINIISVLQEFFKECKINYQPGLLESLDEQRLFR